MSDRLWKWPDRPLFLLPEVRRYERTRRSDDNNAQDDVTRLEWLEARIAPTLEAMGYEVVRAALSGGGRKTLQIMAERRDGAATTVEDCAAISEVLSPIFDVEEPVPGAYDLEVSSPGIDRPLTRPKDFVAYAGHEAKLETKLPLNGRRRFRGILKGLGADGEVLIDVDGTDVSIAIPDVATARLVLTEKLIEASRPCSNDNEKRPN
jgi:ribosome maturation factor RimP